MALEDQDKDGCRYRLSSLICEDDKMEIHSSKELNNYIFWEGVKMPILCMKHVTDRTVYISFCLSNLLCLPFMESSIKL
jgi:hypothetical protein